MKYIIDRRMHIGIVSRNINTDLFNSQLIKNRLGLFKTDYQYHL